MRPLHIHEECGGRQETQKALQSKRAFRDYHMTQNQTPAKKPTQLRYRLEARYVKEHAQ